MKPLILATLLLAALPAVARAQAAAPTDRFGWDQPNTTLVVAQGYRYEVEIDGAAPIVVVATCAGTTTISCTAPIPAVTPSTHVARLRAVDAPAGGTAIPGGWSAPFTFQMRATPGAPVNIRIVPAS